MFTIIIIKIHLFNFSGESFCAIILRRSPSVFDIITMSSTCIYN